MNQVELFEESVSVLKTNKMRTVLSILGIVIGIGSVIALMTLGQASQQSVEERIQSLGSNLLTIRANSNASLTSDDYEKLRTNERITTLDQVAAEYTSNTTAVYNGESLTTSVMGISNNYFAVRNIEVEYGKGFTQSDNDLLNKFAVLGSETATELYGSAGKALGQTIKVNSVKFTVIGITKEKGTMGRTSFDEAVYVPLTTAQRTLFGNTDVSTIYVTTLDESVMEAAENQVGYLLLEQHRLKTPDDADFSIFSQADLLETVSEVTGTFTMLLTGIAAISLVVGGIGIMNIMLVTVTERTREIGIRKALGAKRKTIVNQFLMEAIILTFTGGLLGIVMGIVTSFVITYYMELPSIISGKSILLAFMVSCIIGIVFGWYPAQKASKLQPIEALRYE
jgi:putative ABC transport system permease protein